MFGIYGIRKGDNNKKFGGKERVNVKGYNGIEGLIYKIV